MGRESTLNFYPNVGASLKIALCAAEYLLIGAEAGGKFPISTLSARIKRYSPQPNPFLHDRWCADSLSPREGAGGGRFK